MKDNRYMLSTWYVSICETIGQVLSVHVVINQNPIIIIENYQRSVELVYAGKRVYGKLCEGSVLKHFKDLMN